MTRKRNLFGAIPPWPGSGLLGTTAPGPTYRYRARSNVRATAAAKKRGRKAARRLMEQGARLAGKQYALFLVNRNDARAYTVSARGQGWFRGIRF